MQASQRLLLPVCFRYMKNNSLLAAVLLVVLITAGGPNAVARTSKPVLHGRHWVAITGKPLGATAGAKIFEQGGNAVDAACAMLAVVSTMYDDLSWGGETQALIFDPNQKKVIGVNALGVAPTGATVEFFKSKGMKYPPGYGPLAAVTPGTPGGLMVMLAEFGRLSLKEVMAPAIEMCDGYPIEAELTRKIENGKDRIKKWPYSVEVLLPHLGEDWEAPHAGEIFVQTKLGNTLRKLVETETKALAEGKTRKEAIYAANDRFYRGDIAEEFVRGSQGQGGLHTMKDLDEWQVYLEEPVSTDYKGIEVFKLTCWVQGPVLLQCLNMLEPMDLKSMGYNSSRYIHTLYQVMNLAFADRDFYYGDPRYPPMEPIKGLLSKDYAEHRSRSINWEKNDADVGPGNPYPFEGKTNPFLHLLEASMKSRKAAVVDGSSNRDLTAFEDSFLAGTTSIQASDREGWVVSITPSGGWIPACIAGDTGIAMSQRMQSFVLDEKENPFNLPVPGKRPRATLTPSMALKDGKPFLSFAVQGGDTQDQNMLQFFLGMVEFGMNVQEACEAANLISFQMRSSFGDHKISPGKLTLNEEVPSWVRRELTKMNYRLGYQHRTSGPITAIYFDREHNTMWGGVSDHGEDYGIAW